MAHPRALNILSIIWTLHLFTITNCIKLLVKRKVPFCRKLVEICHFYLSPLRKNKVDLRLWPHPPMNGIQSIKGSLFVVVITVVVNERRSWLPRFLSRPDWKKTYTATFNKNVQIYTQLKEITINFNEVTSLDLCQVLSCPLEVGFY